MTERKPRNESEGFPLIEEQLRLLQSLRPRLPRRPKIKNDVINDKSQMTK